jgi:hypothetical protein
MIEVETTKFFAVRRVHGGWYTTDYGAGLVPNVLDAERFGAIVDAIQVADPEKDEIVHAEVTIKVSIVENSK